MTRLWNKGFREHERTLEMTKTAYLTQQEQEILVRLGDLLIPGGAGMPKASASNLLSGIQRILNIRPDLVDAATEMAGILDGSNSWTVEEIRAVYPTRFLEVAELLAGSYFLDARVTGILDYLDKETIPLDSEENRNAELEVLVKPVVERGSVFRKTCS
ncbi:hypothetical protein OK351_12985 [Glutamicibacter sp. MNS18]|uniref:hypothetical protein n=1 Tax=Glutamicibacter sp. MNS18 TaxID=2989817 RepID=UPI0022361AEF|nr:hypothetical protein [Glutamicibacter sp. MNS18]MCW4466411.1 hypothetical protein [Glutamicibacter sp. MNS18]